MQMPGRSFTSATGYRYGFNGKENDNEVKGDGNQQDYGFRIYDPRLSRFLSVDPLTKKYPWYTPYQFAGNKPIEYIDLDGAEEDKPTSPGGTAVDGTSHRAASTSKVDSDLKSLNHTESSLNPTLTRILKDNPPPPNGTLSTPNLPSDVQMGVTIGGGVAQGLQLMAPELAFAKVAPLLSFGSKAVNTGDALFHATNASESVLAGVNPNYFKSFWAGNRFGSGFYAATDATTALVESGGAQSMLKFTIGYTPKLMNLTSVSTRLLSYKPISGIMGLGAKGLGYDGIMFNSFKNAGGMNLVLFKNFDKILTNGVKIGL